jgi:serine/threonine-protein kinase
MFERAVKLDPAFALAHAKLSESQAVLYYGNVGPLEERLVKAKEAADRALELAPDLPQAHIAMGVYHFRAASNYELALEQFKTARAGLPNDAEVYTNIGAILRHQGEFEEAVSTFEKGLELDPLSAVAAANLSVTLSCLRRYEEAVHYADRSIALLPDQAYAYLIKARTLWMWEGATERSRATIEAIPNQSDGHAIVWAFGQELLERNYQAALDRLSDAPEQIESFPKSALEVNIYRLLNQPERARACAEAARVKLEKLVQENPEWPNYHSALGIIYAALGRREEAIREGQRAIDLLPISTDAYLGPLFVDRLSHIYALVGDHEAALDGIEHLLSIPAGDIISAQYVRIDPRWDKLRHLPRFQKLLEEYE